MKEYKIHINNSRAYITIRIFRYKKQMHKKMIEDHKDHENCEGMFAPANYYLDKNGEKYFQDHIGTMYLHQNKLGAKVVTHECLHAAMACERTLNRFGMKYGFECDDDEERLCYLLGQIVNKVYGLLYDNNHIKSNDEND